MKRAITRTDVLVSVRQEPITRIGIWCMGLARSSGARLKELGWKELGYAVGAACPGHCRMRIMYIMLNRISM